MERDVECTIYKYIHSNLFQETWEASKEKMCERVGVGREERSAVFQRESCQVPAPN